MVKILRKNFCIILFLGLDVYIVPVGFAENKSETVTMPYLLYVKPPFSGSTYETIPKKEEVKDTISIFASQGEYEPASLLVYTLEELKGVTLQAGDLVSEGGEIIPANNIDIKVVKCWWQGGRGTPVGMKVFVPELLLKDDSIELKGWTPSVPKLKEPITFVPANTSKEFWLTVMVPQNAKPGIYKSTLTFKPTDTPSQNIVLKVNVLPIVLLPPAKDYQIFYRGMLTKNEPPHSLSLKAYENQIKDIAEHGFSCRIYDYFPDLKQAYDIRLRYGMKGPFPYLGVNSLKETKEIVQFVKDNDYPDLLFWGASEATTQEAFELCKARFEIVRQAGGKTFVDVTKWVKDGLGDLLDIPVYGMDPETGFHDPAIGEYVEGLINRTAQKTHKKEWYYWQCWLEDPKRNRLVAGFWLWKSRLDGVMPFLYQFNSSGTTDPYDDFTQSQPDTSHVFRPHMTTYPTADGCIDTIQWESAREGVDDVRYITTLVDIIERAKRVENNPQISKQVKESEKVFDSIMARVDRDVRVTFKNLTITDFQNFRWQIAQEIVKIQKQLNPGMQ